MSDQFDEIANEIGHPREAVAFVSGCFQWWKDAPEVSEVSINPPVFCQEFLDHAAESFSHRTRSQLDEWGIANSDDLGRIVFALAEAGLVGVGENDDRSDFEGQFVLCETELKIPMSRKVQQLKHYRREMKIKFLYLWAVCLPIIVCCAVITVFGGKPELGWATAIAGTVVFLLAAISTLVWQRWYRNHEAEILAEDFSRTQALKQ